jgi:NAD(P)-dependent dehydrogenase (short-subunit alcohol dehydrogenase family)
MNRPETIEETAQIIRRQGGAAIAHVVDHADAAAVAQLAEQIGAEHPDGIHILVNDIWGGDHLIQWGKKFWEMDLQQGLTLFNNAVITHIITAYAFAPLLVKRGRGLVVEVTDGITPGYRYSYFYDLAKATVNRLALAQAHEFAGTGVTALALSPGFLRSEAMLDHFGVTEANWRDAVSKNRDFAVSETPHFIGRAVVALACDPDVHAHNGHAIATWNLAKTYGFTDLDGTRPDWGSYARDVLKLEMG